MTKRATLSIFPKFPKLDAYQRQQAAPVRPCPTVARVIPIRVVSRRAIEELIASFNRSATNAR